MFIMYAIDRLCCVASIYSMHLGLGSGKRSMAVQGAGSLNYACMGSYVQLAVAFAYPSSMYT